MLINVAIFASVFSWTNPMTYIFLFMIVMVLVTLRILMQAHKILEEEWGVFKMSSPFSNSFDGLLKWTATNQVKTLALLFLLVLLGAFWVVSVG